MVTTFKTQADKKGNVSQTSRLSSSDSLSLDSAQFLIEATLNYDFDYNDQYTFLRDSKSYEFASNLNYSSGTSKIKTSELEQAYNLFHDSIVTKIDASNKVSVVDISVGVVAGGTIVFKANPIIQIHSNTNPGTWNCSTYGGFSNAIGADPTPLEKQLKYCNFINPYNCYTYFLTNVTTIYYEHTPSPLATNGIYRRSWNFNGATWDLTNIPVAYLWNYANDCTSYVNANTPSITGVKITNVMVHYYPTLNSAGTLDDSKWQLQVQFGVPINISAAGC